MKAANKNAEPGGAGTAQGKTHYNGNQHKPFRYRKQAAKNQPSNGALGDAFYQAMFGKVGAK